MSEEDLKQLLVSLSSGVSKPQTLEEACQIIARQAAVIERFAVVLTAVERLRTENERLLAENEALRKRNESLEERLGTDSGNSSQPPSQDGPASRARRRRKKKRSGRKRGAQPGHKGHFRALEPEAAVDDVQRFKPPQRCACGGAIVLEAAPHRRHQVFDLPPVRYRVTEYQEWAGQCACCGRRHVGRLPEWVPRGQMGAGLVSWIAMLAGEFRLTNRQIQRLLQLQWGLAFSLGAINQAQGPVSGWLQPIYAQIGQAVRSAPVVHADETPHYWGRDRFWLWVACIGEAAYFLVHYSRGKEAAAELLQDYDGILVSDRHGGYNDHPPDRHQLCWAHVIRNLERIGQRRGAAGRLGRKLVGLAQRVVHVEKQWRAEGYAPGRTQGRLLRLRRRIRRLLETGARRHRDTQTGRQCARLLKDEPRLWTFLAHPGLALTNNEAERALRPYVLWRKQSFFSQSYRGNQFRPLILSVVETCKRLGVDTWQLLREACAQGLQGEPVTVRLPLGTPRLAHAASP